MIEGLGLTPTNPSQYKPWFWTFKVQKLRWFLFRLQASAQEDIEEIKSKLQVYTTQEGIEKI